jgi:hypothetical protein
MFRLQEVIVRPFSEHENLKLQWWSAHGIPVETCSLKQDNAFSLVVVDGLCKYTDNLLHSGIDSIKLLHSAHIRKTLWFNNRFNISFNLCLVTPNFSLPFGFSFQLCAHFSPSLCVLRV